MRPRSERARHRQPSRRAVLGGAAGAAGLAATSLLPGCDPPAQRSGPNVVFFLADQFRTDACGAYGGQNIATPNLDRLAAQGLTFDRALSTVPVCAPYRGMLMTGRSPLHSGLLINRVEFSTRQNPNTLGRVFARAGWDTGYIGKWHLAAGARKFTGLTKKEERADPPPSRPHPEFVAPGAERLGFRHWEAYNYHHEFNDYWFYRDTPERIETGRYETDVQTDQALDYMREREGDGRPFLLVVSPHPPHPPFDAQNVPAGSLAEVPHELSWRPNVPPGHPRRRRPLEMRCYLAMCANIDANVGRLLDFLDKSPLGQDTVFVFTSDHGEMHGSHGLQNKMVAYDESVRVPLLMRWPGQIPAGVRTGELQTPLDHLPTMCGLAGIDVPSEVRGDDLSPLVVGGRGPERDAVLMMNCSSHFSFFQTGTDFPEWRAVRTPRHTYVRWLDGSEQLFDDANDPYQLRNLVADFASRAELDALRSRLSELMTAANDEFLPGTAYADWYDDERVLVRTALGPVG